MNCSLILTTMAEAAVRKRRIRTTHFTPCDVFEGQLTCKGRMKNKESNQKDIFVTITNKNDSFNRFGNVQRTYSIY